MAPVVADESPAAAVEAAEAKNQVPAPAVVVVAPVVADESPAAAVEAAEGGVSGVVALLLAAARMFAPPGRPPHPGMPLPSHRFE